MNMSIWEAVGWAVYLGGVVFFSWTFLRLRRRSPEDFTQEPVQYVAWSLGWPIVVVVELGMRVPPVRRWREQRLGKLVYMTTVLKECGVDPADWDRVLWPRLVALGEERVDRLFAGKVVTVTVDEWDRLCAPAADEEAA